MIIQPEIMVIQPEIMIFQPEIIIIQPEIIIIQPVKIIISTWNPDILLSKTMVIQTLKRVMLLRHFLGRGRGGVNFFLRGSGAHIFIGPR